jgi:hypothetical protein
MPGRRLVEDPSGDGHPAIRALVSGHRNLVGRLGDSEDPTVGVGGVGGPNRSGVHGWKKAPWRNKGGFHHRVIKHDGVRPTIGLAMYSLVNLNLSVRLSRSG